MLTLGIPSNVVMALMIGAMMIQGIAPGPQVMVERPQLFWGMIVSMWVGNLMLVVLSLPLIGMWIKLLQVPYRLLFPSILLFMAIGVFSANNNPFDVAIMALFGLFGVVCMKLGMEPAPLASGVLGAADGGEPAPGNAPRPRRCHGGVHSPRCSCPCCSPFPRCGRSAPRSSTTKPRPSGPSPPGRSAQV